MILLWTVALADRRVISEIRILSRWGLGIRAIARELGISRNTVRKYLRGEAVKSAGRRRPGRPRKRVIYFTDRLPDIHSNPPIARTQAYSLSTYSTVAKALGWR